MYLISKKSVMLFYHFYLTSYLTSFPYHIDFLIYDFKSIDSDPILSYFIPVKGKLILSVSLFNTQRLDKNILKLYLTEILESLIAL